MFNMIFWAIVAIGLIVLELTTTQLISIWFALSAIVVFGLTFTDITFTAQLIIFGILSAILIFATRPLSKKIMSNKAVATNADSLIGCDCIVKIEVSNEVGGRVTVNGKEWSARTADNISDRTLSVGEKCIIEEIKGVTLIINQVNN